MPVSSIQRWMSRPRYMRGARTCAPTAIVTGRPERWISSASWMPVADAPTISTPPSASWSGFRYTSAVTTSMPAGMLAANAGTRATLQDPVASTTVEAFHDPSLVVTT